MLICAIPNIEYYYYYYYYYLFIYAVTLVAGLCGMFLASPTLFFTKFCFFPPYFFSEPIFDTLSISVQQRWALMFQASKSSFEFASTLFSQWLRLYGFLKKINKRYKGSFLKFLPNFRPNRSLTYFKTPSIN